MQSTRKFSTATLAVLVSITFVLAPAGARAAVSPLAVAIVPPVQFPPQDFSIAGLRASVIWGRHKNVYGFDLGAIGNVSDLNFGGLAVAGVFNITRGQTTILGLQFAGATNVNSGKATIIGVQATAGINSNHGESLMVGLQIAPLANYSPFTQVWGAQIGLYNKANTVYGFQIGLVNSAESLHGIQIGLLNYHTRGLFAVAPILNVGF